jgi:hypothetical protein
MSSGSEARAATHSHLHILGSGSGTGSGTGSVSHNSVPLAWQRVWKRISSTASSRMCHNYDVSTPVQYEAEAPSDISQQQPTACSEERYASRPHEDNQPQPHPDDAPATAQASPGRDPLLGKDCAPGARMLNTAGKSTVQLGRTDHLPRNIATRNIR